ncbi:MAG: exopolyphosphatase [Arcobacteraceae bacterium]|jgi:exopolyphosphatase/guanosine-5'-triphosphate,3'-diphosphate pyrophosphatase|nr:exopolyphosphatase [Arcobacteraceae bacterium]
MMSAAPVTAIDLGSNSFRVVTYDFDTNTIINEFHEVVGMADGLVQTGKISHKAQQRVIDAINRAALNLNFDPSNAICVTTAAMRYASNNQEVLKNFQEKTGANFKIIDPQEEARLTLLAIKYALKRENYKSEKFIVLDIGGGSTEVIVNTYDTFVAQSFPFGIVTLTQKYRDIKATKKALNLLKEEIHSFIDSLSFDLENYRFIATAGTPTTIAAVKLGLDAYAYDKNKVNGTKVTKEDLYKALELFKNKPLEELTQLVGKGRVEFIEVGILIYEAIFEVLNKNESIVFDDGLREGVAINSFLR